MVMSPSPSPGGYFVLKLLEAIFGNATVDQFGALCLIGWGIFLVVRVLLRYGSGKLPGSHPRLWVLFCLLLGVALVALGGVVMASNKQLAIAAIQDAGGEITRDETMPDRPVVRVDFDRPFRRGATLAGLRPHLESLPQLRYLRITSLAMISDADLVHLEGLTQLKTLELYGALSRSGIERLQKKLPNTQITHDLLDLVPPARPVVPFPRPGR
jgi:hypothetical protein